ncbi:alkaline protease [Pseudomonas haemolytica]|uniref:Alkaline protease n=1 Tax=Pseudomonas haemolytica TaxID=2600065 RepID=A0A646NTB0_9PSED|nr:M10 family metallopeptidase C-terminal domain-containing protein [Pseudomonas haemolytica]MRJ19937.1 alkaline protease [Pseudomonas haemolytica]
MVNVNLPGLNSYVPTLNAAPSRAHDTNEPMGNSDNSHYGKDKQPSKGSKLLSLSAQSTGGFSSLQRLHGSNAQTSSHGLLQAGETTVGNRLILNMGGVDGNVLTANCLPMPRSEETKPQGDQTKPTVDKPKAGTDPKPQEGQPKPAVDKPKVSTNTTPQEGQPKPAVDKPKVSTETKPQGDQPKPAVDKPKVSTDTKPQEGQPKPAVDKPKVSTDTRPQEGQPKPAVDKPKVSTDTKPQEGQPKPAVDKPRVSTDTTPQEGQPKPAVDKPRVSTATTPQEGQPKPAVPKVPVGPTPNDVLSSYDTTYGFNSTTGKLETTLTSASDKPDFNVWDQRGIDTFDFSGFKQDQKIDLRSGSLSSVGGFRENVRIGTTTVIENAVGGSGDDRIMGNSADNVLIGGAGADTLVGGGGWNTFKFNAFSDSTRTQADLLLDFNTGQDKIDLSQMAIDGKVAFNFVDEYTGKPGDTIIKFNPQTGRYLLAIDVDGDGKTDFLIKSTRMISPEDVVGLNIKDGGYL